MLITKETTLADIIRVAIPYDESTHSREFFLEKLLIFPYLEREFWENVSDSWIHSVNCSNEVFFIVNNDSWKHPRPHHTPHIRVGVCGPNAVPTISLDC